MSDSLDMRAAEAEDARFKSNLWQAFARSVRDNIAAEFAVQGLRVGGMLLLARILRPDDFGLLRVLIVVSGFATVLSDMGFPDALVQRKEITPVHEATAWWINLGLAAISAATLYLCAPAVARLMAMPPLASALRLLCLPVLLEGSAVTANARLRRRLRFRVLAAADVIAEFAFLATAVVLYQLGHPRLALVGALAARLTLHALTIWIADFHIPLVLPTFEAAVELGRFAIGVLGASIAICLASNGDYLLVGRLLGATALGYYSISWDLLRFIPNRLHKVAVRVIFPAFSRLQDDNAELVRAYHQLCGYLARVVLPLTVCMAIAAPEVVRALYGAQWTPAAMPLRLLACGLALSGLREGMGAIYFAKGHPEFDIYINTARLILIVVAITSLAGTGLFGVSAAMSAIEGVTSVCGQYLVCLLIGSRIRALVSEAVPGLGLAVWCALATTIGKVIGNAAGLPAPIVLMLVALPPMLIFALLEADELRGMLQTALGRRAVPAMEA